MNAQLRVLRVIERYLQCADEFLARQPQNGFDVYGNPLQCRASTRKGTPCQRMPLPHNGYCPSHQHLAETEEVGGVARGVSRRVTSRPCSWAWTWVGPSPTRYWRSTAAW